MGTSTIRAFGPRPSEAERSDGSFTSHRYQGLGEVGKWNISPHGIDRHGGLEGLRRVRLAGRQRVISNWRPRPGRGSG